MGAKKGALRKNREKNNISAVNQKDRVKNLRNI